MEIKMKAVCIIDPEKASIPGNLRISDPFWIWELSHHSFHLTFNREDCIKPEEAFIYKYILWTNMVGFNGNEIYDGDIVFSNNGTPDKGPGLRRVFWHKNCWKSQDLDVYLDPSADFHWTGLYEPEKERFGCKVVGSIYTSVEIINKARERG